MEALLSQTPFIIFVEIVVSVIICALSFIVIYFHRSHQAFAHIPGPPLDNFFMGHVPSIVSASKQGSHFGMYMLQQAEKYGETFRLLFFHRPVIVTCDPDFIKELLVTGNHPKDEAAYTVAANLLGTRFLGRGLETMLDRKLWARKRAFMNTCFQKSYIRKLYGTFNRCADNLMNHLSSKADGKTKVKMLDKYQRVSLDLISEIILGHESRSFEDGSNEFAEAVLKSLSGFAEIIQNPLVEWNPFRWKDCRDIRKAIQVVRQFGSKAIKDRKDALARGDYVPDDLLMYLIKLEEEYPDIEHEEILDDIVTFFVAGQDTTSSLLGFMTTSLGQNREVLNRLRTEIKSVLGEKPVLTFEDIDKLPYMDKVVKETLRLYPPAINSARSPKKDCFSKGLRIPEGCSVLISMFAVSHLSNKFENPMKFDPERFQDETEISPYTYLPFSRGPHTCIGEQVAKAEAKIVMTKLLQRFDFFLDLDQDVRAVMNATISPKDGAICTLSLNVD